MTTNPTLTVDVAYYQRFLDDPDITDEQRREFIEAVWNMIWEFVRLGYGVHPLQKIDVDNEQRDAPSPEDMLACIDRAMAKKGD